MIDSLLGHQSGFTVLHTAAWHDQRLVGDVLLAAGVDVNAKAKVTITLHHSPPLTVLGGQDGRTALHEAAIRNSLSVATALLAAKADVNATTDVTAARISRCVGCDGGWTGWKHRSQLFGQP